MIKINNFFDNSNVKCIAEGGVFSIYEHQHDLSVDSNTAMNSYFMEQMNVKKRQVLCVNLIIVQSNYKQEQCNG